MDSCFADIFYVWLIEPSEAIWWHLKSLPSLVHKIDGLVQDCSNSSALAVDLLQSCTIKMTCGLFSAKPEPMLAYCEFYPWEQTSAKFESNSALNIKQLINYIIVTKRC